MAYCVRDIWNFDVFGLFYRQPSGWTLCKSVVVGHKKKKLRLPFLAWCNADDFEKMLLMIIGLAQNPRAFNENSGKDLSFDHSWNKKA